ncbi:hypothetical protein COY93_00650 [Candidatus Uhrbacteria bacterium CG_4_10_14_0_8_um_filter_58_22]|uniref:Uncharacterized protein n=1 Tax=Candidatus Uhrbacteria bacterium CG_4_10_14_0_8_um_filter_58_22 TaxID=1975029 RepID=A0A2M7QBX7_9BACT|nr:MAG: hypothetical protein COY93_00650 [Candidatus Uhrbacteria bacterium CG_4_10_14_0_8_um_filter_58_22]
MFIFNMKISQYVREFTSNERILPRHIWAEVKEWLVEVWHRNPAGMKEEFGDVFHFLQLWLFWRFRLDGELWPSTRGSTDKFMNRLKTWRRLYAAVGLPEDISNFCGNCSKLEKVVLQLGRFGVDRQDGHSRLPKDGFGKVTDSLS